jgi:hypothetical protein
VRLRRVFRNFGGTVCSHKSYFVVSLQRPQPTQPTYLSPRQVLLFLTYSLACKLALTADKLVLCAGTPHQHARIDPLVTRLVLITAMATRAQCCTQDPKARVMLSHTFLIHVTFLAFYSPLISSEYESSFHLIIKELMSTSPQALLL